MADIAVARHAHQQPVEVGLADGVAWGLGDDVELLWSRGWRRLHLHLGDDDKDGELLALVSTMRDWCARGGELVWSAPSKLLPSASEATVLRHLPGPVRPDGNPAVEGWSCRPRFGSLVMFRGNGFLQVCDERFGSREILTLEDEVVVQSVCDLGRTSTFETAQLDAGLLSALREAGLLWGRADQWVWLAPRVQRWATALAP